MKKIYIIHENDDWTQHLTKRLDELDFPYESWHLDKGVVDLTSEPPEGVFYNRMSASAHTRGHRYAPELADSVLTWLELYNKTVFNGTAALKLELSKIKQYAALEAIGIKTPKTIGAVGRRQILEAAEKLGKVPFITKHNRAGKGLGVQLFQSTEALADYVDSTEFEEPVDGITLIQEYIQAPEPYITRAEFIGGKFLYAVRVETSEGFELCPADSCQIGDAFCPVGEAQPKFQVVDDVDQQLIGLYEKFLAVNKIDVGAIEFIKDLQGNIYSYDVNTNTNYNADAEAKAGKFGMLKLAEFLGSALKEV